MEFYFAGAYWGDRREDLAECVTRTRLFLASLATVSGDFLEWRAKGVSRKAALSNPSISSTSEEALTQLFAKGRNRKDIGNEVIEELGFGIAMWNGLPDARVASLSIGCGKYATIGSSNVVMLGLPPSFDVNSADMIAKLMTAMVGPWDPEWAVVSSQTARNAQREHKPFLDKALYVRSEAALPPDLPNDVVASALERGRLVMPAAVT
ncbi:MULTISPECIES: Imm52 family immunity protein [unclassified Variovorax]|uniref:Imm52 family immunity protein n=1 Tax=unclassified Variovorax TaxID=663243 RepID=UPI003ED0DB15